MNYDSTMHEDASLWREDSTPYLEGQGDLVSRLIIPITHIVTLIIPLIYLLSPPDPPSRP